MKITDISLQARDKNRVNVSVDGKYRFSLDIFQVGELALFIPLEARIFVSKKFPEYFYDEKALELECHISDRQIRKKSSEYAFMASVARYYNLDEMTQASWYSHFPGNIL